MNSLARLKIRTQGEGGRMCRMTKLTIYQLIGVLTCNRRLRTHIVVVLIYVEYCVDIMIIIFNINCSFTLLRAPF